MVQNVTGDPSILVLTFYPLIVETLLFGVFSCLTVLSTYLLLWRPRSVATLMMLFLTTTMYIAAAVHWGACLAAAISGLSDPANFLLDQRHTADQVLASIGLTINVVLSDVIVVWRAWLLWERSRGVLVVSFCLLIATAVAAIFNGVYLAGHVLATFLMISTAWPTVTAAISIATNIWATALVAYKAWLHRRFIRQHIQGCKRRTRVELLLSLLIESGSVYCIYLIVVLLSTRALLGPLCPVFGTSVAQIAGIYPTTLVVLVCLRKGDKNPIFSLEQQTETLEPRIHRITFQTFSRSEEGSSAGHSLDEEDK
ncbi:hypothetical protein BV25DRAFT_1420634 [Artomyces pyxidatus]|uniref:Uncharacterized protein n=1 Tax=Artomyces pyxidatus TaxID=48021 RepID=A0ACB8TE65_9AGAM|nr:hypothetical protein BV25DRAFT_1420634 [Artomyces pyxidatus]